LTPSPPPCRVLLRNRGPDANPAYRHAATQGSGEILKGRRKLDAAKRWLAEAVIGNAALWSRALHGAVTSFLLLRYRRRGCKSARDPNL